MDSGIFKAYDIRGTYPDQMDEEAAKLIGQAVVQLLGAKKVVIGHDMRLSADTLYPKLTEGLIEMGCEVIDIGLCSTPMSYFANVYFKADASLMMTASHNPSQYNGFKLCGKDAQPITSFFPTTEVDKVIRKWENGEGAPDVRMGGFIKHEDILDEYIEKICEGVEIDPEKLGKIVLDGGNGMAGLPTVEILKHLKIDFEGLYLELDGRFPNHEPNPLKHSTLKDLQATVIRTGAVIGAAVDGDADRIGFVDERGEVIPADMVTILIAKEMMKHKKDLKVMYDLRSSWAVKEEIESAGGSADMCMVGHGLIKPVMRKGEVDFAGELSAHYYFKELSYTDNADKALVAVLQLLSESDKKMSELIAPFKRYFATGEINFEVSDPKAKIDEIEGLVADGEKLHLDGLSVELSDWWFNLRASNTEPLLRLNLEAKTAELRDEKLKWVIELIGVEPIEE